MLRASSSIQRYIDQGDWTSGLGWASRSVLVKATASVSPDGDLLLLSGQKFPRNRGFLGYGAKTGSCGAKLVQTR